MNAGKVSAVRELVRGVQADVCLGADVQHGYATIRVESNSPEVLSALEVLKDALRQEALAHIESVQNGHIARLQAQADALQAKVTSLQKHGRRSHADL